MFVNPTLEKYVKDVMKIEYTINEVLEKVNVASKSSASTILAFPSSQQL